MIITADECVQELSEYLQKRIEFDGVDSDIRIFQYEDKPKTYKKDYIAINALPFVYGYMVNDKCILNLNIHTVSMSDGTYYRKHGTYWLKYITELIPLENATEDYNALELSKAHYTIANISQPRKDTDNTHYVNCQIKIRFAL